MIKAEIRINRTLPTELIKLMNKCGERKRSPKTVIKALRDGLFMVGLYVNGELVAFGRVSGDGAMYFLITDVMVDPAYEDSGADMQCNLFFHRGTFARYSFSCYCGCPSFSLLSVHESTY